LSDTTITLDLSEQAAQNAAYMYLRARGERTKHLTPPELAKEVERVSATPEKTRTYTMDLRNLGLFMFRHRHSAGREKAIEDMKSRIASAGWVVRGVLIDQLSKEEKQAASERYQKTLAEADFLEGMADLRLEHEREESEPARA
jgi:hypothetical protein